MTDQPQEQAAERPPEGLTWRLEGDLFELIKAEVLAYWAEIQEKYADQRITLLEVYELAASAVQALVRIGEQLDVPNAQKRALLLEVIDETYVQVIAPLDIVWIPNVFEPIVDRLIGELVHTAARQALEYLLPDAVPIPEPVPPTPQPLPNPPAPIDEQDPAKPELPEATPEAEAMPEAETTPPAVEPQAPAPPDAEE